MDLSLPNETSPAAGLQPEAIRLRIVGVGGAGANVVDRMKLDRLDRLDLAIVDTDFKVLGQSPLTTKVLLGRGVTRGFGTGGDFTLAGKLAEEESDALDRLVGGVDLLFLVAGVGGGVGAGVTPVLAARAAEAGALVITFAILPFTSEGAARARVADECTRALREVCHAVITLPNDQILQETDPDTTILEAMAVGDSWIRRGVTAIWSLLCRQGLMNVDLASLRGTLSIRGGRTLFGIGRGEGPDAAEQALRDLEVCPLLHMPDVRARADALVIHIIGGPDLTLSRVHELLGILTRKFESKERTTIGAVIDEDWQGRVEICVLGTSDLASPRQKAWAKPAAAHGGGLAPAGPAPAAAGAVVTSKAPAKGKARSKQRPAAEQDEFGFDSGDQRGYFEKTAKNLYQGEDLDVPTYMRRGVRIKLEV